MGLFSEDTYVEKTTMFIKKNIVIIMFVTLLIGILVAIYLYENKQSVVTYKMQVSEGFENGQEVHLVHAKWCGHCKNFMPEWKTLEQSLGQSRCKSYEVDDPEAKAFIEKHGVNSFPTILCGNGDKLEKYYGPRTAESIINYMNAKTDVNVTDES
jgi:thiol-disulfide isomerase/thioredoxin